MKLYFLFKNIVKISICEFTRSPEKKEKKRMECGKFCTHFGHLITLMASLFTMILLVMVYFIMPPPPNPATGKSLSEALILASTNPQYDDRLFIDSRIQ